MILPEKRDTMKRFIRTSLILFACMVSFTACSDEESLSPSGNYSPIRGGFPQGDSKYDSIIGSIKNEYEVYLLYKDITEADLNRDWVSAGTGDIYVAGYEEEREDLAWNLPEEHLPFYVDYFYNYIFPNISKEFAKSTFPVKIYMIHNLRTEPRDFGEEDNEESGGGTDTNPYKSIKLGNFDNWAISFKDEIINGTDTEYALRQQRCIFIIQAIYNAMNKNEIVSPDEFWTGFDFSDDMIIDHYNPSKSNYKYKLGFVDDIYDHYATTGRTDDVWNPKTYILHSYNWAKGNKDNNLFAAYIKNAMWLTPEQFEARYPSSKYPMIKEKYNLVVDYMLETYGLNLVGIAKGLEKE